MKVFFKFFAERHLLANVLTIMIFLMGMVSLMRINRSELPNVDIGRMIIRTRYPGASPEDVELNVTNKIEDELKTITGIKQITSTSMENNSVITIEIDDDVSDINDVQTEIREAVSRVGDLPQEVTESPVVQEIKTTLKPIIEVGLTSDDLPYAELREYARLFEKKLKELPGIAHITRYGYRAREIRVEVSPDNMMKYAIPMREIITAIQTRNIRSSGGSLESYTSEKNVLTLAQFRDPMEVGDVIIRSSFNGAIVRVKDLAIVHDDFEEERIIPRMNGKKAISFLLSKSEDADIIRTVDAVKALVKKEKPHLPDSIEFLYTDDESKNIRTRYNIVVTNGIIGLILVLAVLSLFLNVRSAFWVAMGIPFAMLGVFILFPAFNMDMDGITLNAMVLVIGMLVDDAIVVSENIFQRREKGDTPLEAAINGVHEVYLPVFTTVTTTIIAFFPMFFIKGILGKFVFVVPLTISLALAVSLFESFFILPAHILPGLRAQSGGKIRLFGRAWFRPVRNIFEKFLASLMTWRYVWIILAIAILAGSVFYARTYMGFVLFDSKGANGFSAIIELPIGTSLQATADKTKEIEAIIANLPEGEVESYAVRIGASRQYVDNENEHIATLTVNLTPYSTRVRTADEIVESVREQTAQLTGIRTITFTVQVAGPPTGKPIEIRVVGSDDTLRTRLVDAIVTFLNDMEGVKDVDRDDKAGKDEIAIRINHERLARYGLTVADIAQNIRIAYDGQIVTSTRYGEEDVEFRVMLQKQFRGNVEYLKQLRIPNRQGELIALDEVASLDIGAGAFIFRHYNGERTVTIEGDVLQDITTPVEVMKAVGKQFDLDRDYPGIQMLIGGEAAESREAMIDLLLVFGIAALGIYFLLMLLFNSVTQPLIVILAIPFGICGVILAFALHGEPLSFLAIIGSIGLVGVVVNDSLVLVAHLNELIRGNDGQNLVNLIAAGAAARLRPIILTTLTTVAGLLPLAYGIGGESIEMAPMGLALGYGLLFATPVTLVLIPCLYMIGHDIKTFFTKNEYKGGKS